MALNTQNGTLAACKLIWMAGRFRAIPLTEFQRSAEWSSFMFMHLRESDKPCNYEDASCVES